MSAAAGPERGYSVGESDTRPWGEWEVLDVGPGYAVKRIVVRPGGRLSLQRHRHRDEHWVVVAGTARVTRAESVFDLPANGVAKIDATVAHRIENPGPDTLLLIEVQTGALLSESDIVRLDDDYGRA